MVGNCSRRSKPSWVKMVWLPVPPRTFRPTAPATAPMSWLCALWRLVSGMASIMSTSIVSLIADEAWC